MERLNQSRELNQKLNKVKIVSHSNNIDKLRKRKQPEMLLKTSPCRSIVSSASEDIEKQAKILTLVTNMLILRFLLGFR